MSDDPVSKKHRTSTDQNDIKKERDREKEKKVTDIMDYLYVSPIILRKYLPSPDQIRRVTDQFARSLRLTTLGAPIKPIALFLVPQVKELLQGKMVVFCGDSVTRGIYKDIVHMCHSESLTYPFDMMKKAELRFEGDMLVKGAKLDGFRETNGVDFEEIRLFVPTDFSAAVSYNFMTKMWNSNISRTLDKVYFDGGIGYGVPDIMFVNSCNWDLVRHKKFRNVEEFEEAYDKDVRTFTRKVMEWSKGKTCLIFLSSLPLGKHCTGAFLSEKKEDIKSHGSIWRYIKPANEIVRRLVDRKRKDGKPIGYLDLHSLAVNLDLLPWRENVSAEETKKFASARQVVGDGTHWKPQAHRLFSYAILSLMSKIFQNTLPTTLHFEPYLKACDDLAQLDVYLRWLTTAYLRKTGAMLQEIEIAWENRNSEPKPAGCFPSYYAENASVPTPRKEYSEEQSLFELPVTNNGPHGFSKPKVPQAAPRRFSDSNGVPSRLQEQPVVQNVSNWTEPTKSHSPAVPATQNGGSVRAGQQNNVAAWVEQEAGPRLPASPFPAPTASEPAVFEQISHPRSGFSQNQIHIPKLQPSDGGLVSRLQKMSQASAAESPQPSPAPRISTPPFYEPEDVSIEDCTDNLPIGVEACDLNYINDEANVQMMPGLLHFPQPASPKPALFPFPRAAAPLPAPRPPLLDLPTRPPPPPLPPVRAARPPPPPVRASIPPPPPFLLPTPAPPRPPQSAPLEAYARNDRPLHQPMQVDFARTGRAADQSQLPQPMPSDLFPYGRAQQHTENGGTGFSDLFAVLGQAAIQTASSYGSNDHHSLMGSGVNYGFQQHSYYQQPMFPSNPQSDGFDTQYSRNETPGGACNHYAPITTAPRSPLPVQASGSSGAAVFGQWARDYGFDEDVPLRD